MSGDPVRLAVPGDKSISHRALMLAALAPGESRFENLNTGTDVAATAAALARCGVHCELRGAEASVAGGGLADPPEQLDFGNSGTGVRLMAGLLAGAGAGATLTGDASLRSRPMDRVVLPLRKMGARIQGAGGDRFLPLVLVPAALRPLEYALPVASAQVKSCLLLAGLAGRVRVRLHEPAPSRDHTERMLVAMGAGLRREGAALELEPAGGLSPLRMCVPGDLSSAAFLVGLGALVPGLALELEAVGTNPGRTGFLDVLRRMGADVRATPRGEEGGEPVADLRVAYSGRLEGVDVPRELAPRVIDEVPLLAVVAARARGLTRIRGVGELRVKESDRLRAIAAGLRAVGVSVRELPDALEVEGSTRPPRGEVDTRLDHRIAMAFSVLACVPGADVRLSESASLATSFPEFPSLLERALA